MGSSLRRLPAVAAALVVTATVLVGPAGAAQAAVTPGAAQPAVTSGSVVPGGQPLAPGVELSTFRMSTAHGTATGDLLSVDLADPHVSVDLLHPPTVAAREQVSAMTAGQGAIAGVNADFFDIDESQHPGVSATGSSDGPEVTQGQPLKAAVPNSQRFGPAMAPGTSTRDVIGVGVDGLARVGSLQLVGSVRTPGHQYPLGGFNQYALPENSIGAFTSAWGPMSRQRAVCGSDAKRGDPCATDTAEVTVRRGRVVAVAAAPGEGQVASDSVVLVGREQGADELRALQLGDPVEVRSQLVATQPVAYRFAVGGAPILRGGTPLPGVDNTVAATRTAAGISPDGHHLYLVVLDGQTEAGSGLTLFELATLLASLGASDGVNLDGGGSSTCAVKLPGDPTVTVVNAHPAGVAERPVANGIGIFTHA
jgi:hypothetical protein